ncbi:MAG TPA: hypothetical protein VIC08_09350 [Cellvibrionaceae bacterium]
MLNNKRFCILAWLMVLPLWAGAEVLRDPTAPLVSRADGSEQGLQLHSVLISQDRKLAIINGVAVRVGEALPGRADTVVEQIDPKRVIVRKGSVRETLHLHQEYLTKEH